MSTKNAKANAQHVVFDTEIGACAIVFSPQAVLRFFLPAETLEQLVERLAGVPPGTPPPWLKKAIARIERHLAGQPQDLDDIPVDMSGLTPFTRRVYEAARTVGPGKTASYGEIAIAAGAPGAARAVGTALSRNPFALLIPCHRIVAAGNKAGGFSAPGGLCTKMRMLAAEGADLPRR